MPYKQGGKWRASVMVNRQRISKLFDTRQEAKKWEAEEKARLNNGEPIPAGMDFNLFCSKYLDHAELQFTKGTYGEKSKLCRDLINHWGKEIPVSEITVAMVADYLQAQAVNRSANSANRDRKNMMSMFNWGQKILDFPKNPVSKVDKFKHDREPQYTPPTEDILRLLAAATREEKVFLDCYLHTAARKSEIFRLRWIDDINFEKRLIRLGTRKTKGGIMEYIWMPMNEELHESLWWQWNNRQCKESPYVFVDTQIGAHQGQPYTERRRFMLGLCERAGVKPFGFHALRRYVASILADTHKLSSKRIQRILRHKNVTTTERYIQNLNDDMRGGFGFAL